MSVNFEKFKGYRYNMITWAYSDGLFWEDVAKYHMPGTKYSKSYLDFEPIGKFWEREKNKNEAYRRNGGQEGFGGDNAYASYEIVRYILYSLNLKSKRFRRKKEGKK